MRPNPCLLLRVVVVALVMVVLAIAPGCGQGASGPEVELPTPPLRRLTEAQYLNVVQDLFGEGLFVPGEIEPDQRVRGLLSVGASIASISPRGVEGFERAAYVIAAQLMEAERREQIITCSPAATVDADCARASLAPLARRAWRRAVSDEELDALVAIAGSSAETLGDFYAGFEFALGALLQDPAFLYRAELGEPDPDGRWDYRFSNWDMASRLSFFLWNTIPDDELLDAAQRGELTTDAGLRAQVERMLSSERSRVGLRSWIADVLHLGELEELYKDPQTFVHMSDTLGESAREETLLLFEDLVLDGDGDMRELLTTRKTFLNRELATLYSVQAPAREGFASYEFPEDALRRGLLGHASLLAMNSHPASSSPTLRGRFILEVLLCQVIPGPPAGVDTSIPPPSEAAATLRERVQLHLTDPACSGCHRSMDLLGLGLENFDGIGRYRSQDNERDIDASGEVSGVEFADYTEMAELLAESEEFTDCLMTLLFRAAAGHGDDSGQDEGLNWLHDRFADTGYRMKPVLTELIMSALFRQAGYLEPAGADPLPPLPIAAPGPAFSLGGEDRR